MVGVDTLKVDDPELSTDAFIDLVEPALSAGYRLAFGLLRAHDQAEDAVQQAMLNAWKRRRSFRRGEPMRPWFLAIVANECRQAMRSRWWSVIRMPDLTARERATEAEADDADRLRRGLLRLGRTDRLVLVLRYYLDLSFEEVGATLGISPVAARVRTHRALGRLRPIIDVPEELNP